MPDTVRRSVFQVVQDLEQHAKFFDYEERHKLLDATMCELVRALANMTDSAQVKAVVNRALEVYADVAKHYG